MYSRFARLMIIVSSLATCLAVATMAFGHGGNPHLMGTVTAIDDHRIEIKTTEGKTVSATLTKDTKYFKGETSVARTDVKVGSRVVVHCEGKPDHLTAHEVRMPEEKKA